jgi:hypothetical protein
LPTLHPCAREKNLAPIRDKDEKVKASLKDAELLQQFKAVEQFSDDDKTVVKKLIDAFIVKKQLQLMAS